MPTLFRGDAPLQTSSSGAAPLPNRAVVVSAVWSAAVQFPNPGARAATYKTGKGSSRGNGSGASRRSGPHLPRFVWIGIDRQGGRRVLTISEIIVCLSNYQNGRRNGQMLDPREPGLLEGGFSTIHTITTYPPTSPSKEGC